MHENYPRKKVLLKLDLLKDQTYLDTNQGLFWKEQTKGYLNNKFMNSVTNIFLEYP